MQKILLPGGDKQLDMLIKSVNLSGKKILVAGANSAPAAEILTEKSAITAEFIVEEYESLINANLYLAQKEIIPKMMDFTVTDFKNDEFDLIYVQSSISTSRRKLIVKEFKRILKSGGMLCVGELTLLQNEFPGFVRELIDRSDLHIMDIEELKKYYSDRNFEIKTEYDLSGTLKEFYSTVREKYLELSEDLNEQEKSYYKKLLKKASHEANAFLDFGADRYIGFHMMIMKLNK